DASIFQGMTNGLTADRPGFLDDFVKKFFNYEEGKKNKLSEAAVHYNWIIGSMASPKGSLDCVQAFAQTDFRNDLKKFTIPTLVVHGDKDQIVPFEVSGKKAHELIEGCQMEIIKGGPHGLPATHAEDINRVLLDFLKQ
ncbi:MAG TPA: alpha/beta hydrolase, partial [Candidatus Limnocylindrales bacterium]|nr:alpha/beta hydrolase [Candidatus Limnocylindrales bacterium]